MFYQTTLINIRFGAVNIHTESPPFLNLVQMQTVLKIVLQGRLFSCYFCKGKLGEYDISAKLVWLLWKNNNNGSMSPV